MQFSRRRFIEAGAVMTVLPLAGQARTPAKALAVVDTRHREGRNFALHYRNDGGSVHSAIDDISRLWLEQLGPVARRNGAPLIGLTRSSTLFCLEQLAWTHGMRVVLHAEFAAAGLQRVVHRNGVGISFAAIDAAGTQWPQALAATLAHCSDAVSRPGPSAVAEPARFDLNDTTLHAWALARCGTKGATA